MSDGRTARGGSAYADLLRLDGDYRLSTFLKWWRSGHVPRAEALPMFDLAWAHAEVVWQLQDDALAFLRELRSSRDIAGSMPSRLTVYRGVSTPAGANGVSWTTDQERAQMFADRAAITGGEPLVYEATVTSIAILRCLDHRREQEVLVDPNELHDVRLVPSI